MERKLLREALAHTGGNKLAAARALYRMIDQYGVGEREEKE
jgi:hypothetical protein